MNMNRRCTIMVNVHRLKQNAVNLGDAIIIGLASSGPAQSMAVSLAAIVAASGYAGVLPIVISFIPMIGIALAYQRLNRWNQNCGATYTWVAQTINPYLGFIAGWMILLYYTLGTTSLTLPVGTYTIQLFNPQLTNNNVLVGLIGALWDIFVMLLVMLGIKIAARFQWTLSIFEYVVLMFFAALAIVAMINSHTAVPVSASWFTIGGAGGIKGLLAGILIAVFLYSGWDAAIYINEETTNKEENPGKAAISSVVILMLIFSIVTFAYQGVLPYHVLQKHASNALAVVAQKLAPGPWQYIMTIIVLTGTVASLQAAIISAARLGYAMSFDRVMPRFFQKVSAKTGTPWAVTLFMGSINIIFLVASLAVGSIGQALSNVVSALGLIAAIFYALTGLAAVWAFRNELTKNLGNLILGGVLPLVGAAFLIWVVVESIVTQATTVVVLVAGLGATAVSIPIMVALRYFGKVPFFTGKVGTPTGVL